ncbi:Putative major facilitator superfamily, MFS transporter superfamily [Septoria linicola]|uniref:Major facilitator superfamily, MFS transporter superfamily n=1 Tax=Septoria linicola TaxID=215465 RepID=A0A9Q9AW61_9PEZI|nr:putative major facilitator superfamily, MFS transporter superfamily [Septoria linicola]USW56255.1 Putative major facilitator superfamily, MFS transporter superfamily [Septoria linicola]
MATSKTAVDMIEEHDPRKNNSIIGHEASQHGDRALAIIGDERVSLTEEDNKRIRRKTNKVILCILIWVYFLQILDKTVLGYGATFGMKEATGLVGNQYSLVGSIAPIAQLAWQPFSSYLIVRVPHRILMPSLVLGWGIAQTCMAAAYNYHGLLAARFFLGLFEGGCLPLFSIITSQWYRRAEQPIIVAAWYSTNGLATIAASALSFGLGHIQSSVLESWQIIFMFVGLVTVITAPFVYWKLDNDIPSARFLTEDEKPQAIERLRANQTGTGSREFKWDQVRELALDGKTYLWIALSLLLNVGASVTNTFGPLIISGFGYDKFITSLLNMPFGALQFIIILFASWAAQKFKNKSLILVALVAPVVAGLAMLYTISHTDANQGALMAGYYLLSFLFGGNPLIVSWIVGNTAGTTKKSTVMSVYNAASSAGNIIGPLLFNSKDAPTYRPGLRAVLGIFVALAACVLLQAANLMFLNKLQERKRVKNGKPAKIRDQSMQNSYQEVDDQNNYSIGAAEGDQEAGTQHARIGDQAFLDIGDRKNDEFIYIL